MEKKLIDILVAPVKLKLSKNDTKFFKEFREKYDGWDIIRREDNSLEFIKPVRE